jgi:hypothetical protein
VLTKPVYYTLDCYQILNKNMKRHRKLFEQLEEFLANQQDIHRRSINTQYSNVVNTALMDTVITKNIIECENSDLIDRMSYKSGEITTYNPKDLAMSSILDVSVFSQFKSLSKALAKEEETTAKKKEFSPIKKKLVERADLTKRENNSKTKPLVGKLNTMKSVESVINSIKSKYNKLRKLDMKEDLSKIKFNKPGEAGAKPKKGVVNIANFQSAVLRSLKETSQTTSQLCTTRKDDVSMAESVKRENSNKNVSLNRMTLRKQSNNKDSIGSSLGFSGGVEQNQDRKSVYNINFNLNLNLNVKQPDKAADQSKSKDRKPRIISNLEIHKNMSNTTLTDRNNNSIDGKNPYYKSAINNIKNLYYEQFPKKEEKNRDASMDSINKSRSRSYDKYGRSASRNDISKGLIYNQSSSKKPKQPASDIFSLKTKVSQSPRKSQQGISSYNSYYTKGAKEMTAREKNSMQSYQNSLSNINNSVIRKSKGDVKPSSINLNTVKIDSGLSTSRCETTSKEKSKNKVFK